MLIGCLALVGLACNAVGAERIAKGDVQYEIDDTPAWVTPADLSMDDGSPARGPGTTRHRLFDYQVALTGDQPQRYWHHAYTVLTPSAVERAANIPIAFSPDSERLTLHTLSVIRGGKRIDQLRSARLEVLRRELSREHLMYDGVVTADFLLSDVRVGDTVDVAYTLTGSNAVLGEKFNTTFPLAFAEPVDDLRVRVLYPAGRVLDYKVLHADVTPHLTDLGSRRELTVRRQNVDALDMEPATAVDDIPMARLRVTEYRSWSEVTQWADRVYRVPDDLSPALRQMTRDIKARSTSDADAVRQAFKFVQQDIRYVGVEIGEGSFRPRHPNQVLEQRYGDCKDKALLLSAVLRGLGYRAYPALVSTFIGRDGAAVTPMPRVFNHMIVMIELGDTRYWLDATRTFQEGTLERIGNPLFHWALVTGQAAQKLTPVESGKQYVQQVDVRYQFAIHDYREPASLETVEVYSGVFAEAVRAQLAGDDRKKMVEGRQQELQRIYPGVSLTGELTVSDDVDRDQLTLTAQFALPQFFEAHGDKGVGRMYAALIRPMTEPPAKLVRTAPLALVYPMAMSTVFTIDFPEDVGLNGSPPLALADDNLEFSATSSYQARRLQVEYKIATRRHQVPVNEVKSYADMLHKIRERLGFTFQVAAPRSPMAPLPGKTQGSAHADESAQIAADLDRQHEGKAHVLSATIESGKLDDTQLAAELVERAITYSDLDRVDAALPDLARAMALDPKRASPYVVRGEIYTKLGEFDRALEDFARALALDPAADVLGSRGHAYYLKGDYRAAQADFKRLAETATQDEHLHALIWLYLATQRLGESGKAVVSGIRSRANLSQWPGPAVMMMLGDSTPEEMLAAAWTFDRKTELLQRCEAYFFLAQYRLLAGDRSGARDAFDISAATGVKQYLEYNYSRLELARLAGGAGRPKRAEQ
jgi:lipoprotein NlpI